MLQFDRLLSKIVISFATELKSVLPDYIQIANCCAKNHVITGFHNSGESVPVPDDAGSDRRVTLKQYVAEYRVTDITGTVMDPVKHLTGFVTNAAEYISSKIESSVLEQFNNFPSQVGDVNNGIDLPTLQDADQFLFDHKAPDQEYHLILADPGWEQLQTQCNGNSLGFHISSPSADLEYLIPCNLAMHKKALLFTSAHSIGPATSYTENIEIHDIGLTIVGIPDRETKSILIRVELLCSADIVMPDLAVKIPLPIGYKSRRPKATVTAQQADTIPDAVPVTPADFINRLPNVINTTVLRRLITTSDSLTDIIPDPAKRYNAAITLLNKQDHITTQQLLDACELVTETLTTYQSDFDRLLSGVYDVEITNRESRLKAIEKRIVDLQEQIRLLERNREQITGDIQKSQDQIAATTIDHFNAYEVATKQVADLASIIKIH